MFSDVLFVDGFLEKPRASGVGVSQGFLSGEGFGGDEKESGRGATYPKDLDQLGGVDVRNEVHLQVASSEGLEGFGDHDRTEVGSANADIHDVGDGLTRVALPGTRTNLLGKGLHMLPGRFNLWHNVLTVDKEGLVGGTAEGDVEDRSIFGEIDLFAPEHSVAELFDLSFFQELAEKVKSL